VVCCGPAGGGFAHCFACRTVSRRLGLPLAPVLPVGLCPVPGPLYTVLLGYKESPVAEARRCFSDRVRQLFGTFLAEHRACVEAALGGPADLVLPVPSSSRPGPSPLERVDGLAELVASTLGAGAHWSPRLLGRTGRAAAHMRPNARALVVADPARSRVIGARVLLLDDTYVSGSRAQSAAAALRLGGAGAALIVPLGRVVRPDRSLAHAAFVQANRDGGHLSPCVAVETAAQTAAQTSVQSVAGTG
jgi:hypothetical protein